LNEHSISGVKDSPGFGNLSDVHIVHKFEWWWR